MVCVWCPVHCKEPGVVLGAFAAGHAWHSDGVNKACRYNQHVAGVVGVSKASVESSPPDKPMTMPRACDSLARRASAPAIMSNNCLHRLSSVRGCLDSNGCASTLRSNDRLVVLNGDVYCSVLCMRALSLLGRQTFCLRAVRQEFLPCLCLQYLFFA